MAKIRRWGVNLLRRTGRVLMVMVFLVILVLSLSKGSNVPHVAPHIGGNAHANHVQAPSMDERVINQAKATDNGKQLTADGYTGHKVIDDHGLVQFLNDQQKRVNATPQGPYVAFSKGMTNPAKPDPGHPPDIVIDASSGLKLGLYQDYTDNRGATCFADASVDNLLLYWPALQVYLWHKSLDASYVVTHSDLATVPDNTSVYCYTQAS